jgi:CBS domain-containing protein
MGILTMEVNSMKVKDIMSKDVACVCSSDSIETAAKLMKQYDVGSLPVCDQNKLIGIVTDRDITLRCVATGNDCSQQKVCDVMTSDPAVGSPEMSVKDVTKIMSDKKIRRLPIVDENSLVGIVALGDISLEPALQDKAEDALSSISKHNHFH